jgi:acyl dehydratase
MDKSGLYFEELLTDKTYYTLRRTITEADHINFTTSFGFFEPLFMDQAYVENETRILHGTGMAFLGVEMNVLKPVFIGDTITVEIDVIDKREAKKADRGIVTFSHRVINQDNTGVMDYKIKRMLRRKI